MVHRSENIQTQVQNKHSLMKQWVTPDAWAKSDL